MTDHEHTPEGTSPPPTSAAGFTAPLASADDSPSEVRPAVAPIAEDPAPVPQTTPVVQPASPRPNRARLIAAGLLSVLVIGIAAVGTLLLTGSTQTSKTLAWTPAGSVMVMETRLDLPGGQRQAVGELLSVFPGFDDQAILDRKIGEVLDRLVREATDGKHDYLTEIDPWFGGEIAFSSTSLPTDEDAMDDARFLALLSVDDGTAARAWVDARIAESGATTASVPHGSVTITTLAPDDGDAPVTFGYATYGSVLALGDVESLKTSIDTNGSSALDDEERFKAAMASLPAERLGFAFVDASSFPALSEQLDESGGAFPIPSGLSRVIDEFSATWTAMSFRVEDRAIVIDTRVPHMASLAGTPANHASALAAHVPADTLVLLSGHDVGAGLDRFFTLLKEDPEIAQGFADVESQLAMLGGLDGVVGWLGDTGVALVPEGDSVAGGLVITPTDRSKAERLLTTFRSALAFAGGSLGITVRDDEHGDATITVVTIEDVPALVQQLGSMDPSGAATDTTALPQTLELAYAVTDTIVVLGSSPAFVASILDAPAGDSLAEQERFSTLLARAGIEHSGLTWIDLAGSRALIEGAIPEAERARYETEVKPYLEHIDALLGTGVAGADIDRGTVLLTVSE